MLQTSARSSGAKAHTVCERTTKQPLSHRSEWRSPGGSGYGWRGRLAPKAFYRIKRVAKIAPAWRDQKCQNLNKPQVVIPSTHEKAAETLAVRITNWTETGERPLGSVVHADTERLEETHIIGVDLKVRIGNFLIPHTYQL